MGELHLLKLWVYKEIEIVFFKNKMGSKRRMVELCVCVGGGGYEDIDIGL